MFDCYFDEVKETQGYIFEQFVLQGYTFKDSVIKYMKSDLKYRIDLRHPKETNFLGGEQIDALKKEVNLIYIIKIHLILFWLIGWENIMLHYN